MENTVVNIAVSVLTNAGAAWIAGIGLGYWLWRRRLLAAAEREQNLRQVMIELQEMSAAIADDVGKHASRIEEITHDLLKPSRYGVSQFDQRVVLDTISQMVLSNKKLLTKLVATEHRLADNAGQLNLQLSQVRIDSLTGLANRRAFEAAMAERFDEWKRTGAIFSIMMVELDAERWAQLKGTTTAVVDLVQRSAHAISATMRDMDLVARFSNEQFAILLPMTALHDATRAAERLLEAVAQLNRGADDHALRPTAYVGVAEMTTSDNLRSLTRRADSALSVARESGLHCGYFHDGQACHPIMPQSALPAAESAESTDAAGMVRRGEAKLAARTQHYAQYVAALSVDARTDVLTGLPNRRAFSDELRRRIQDAVQNTQPLSLLVVGVENLSRIGTTHGQEAVDMVLRKVAQVICAAVRDSDIVTRFGWEEFAVILPGIGLDEATYANRRLLAALACCSVDLEHIDEVTISSGLADMHSDDDGNSLAHRADEAMRAARLSGESTARFHAANSADVPIMAGMGGDPAAATRPVVGM